MSTKIPPLQLIKKIQIGILLLKRLFSAQIEVCGFYIQSVTLESYWEGVTTEPVWTDHSLF